MLDNKPILWQPDGTIGSWDGLRRDQELWLPNGDCAIYLYAQGQSRRGPSFHIPFQALITAKCGPLLDKASSGSEDSCASYLHSRSSSEETASSSDEAEVHRIYLGAPQHLSNADTIKWHITTRNFFAWLLNKPLVGSYLSQTLSDLLERMSIYRDSNVNNTMDLIDYADSFGYTDFANKPDLALAILSFAEEFKMVDVWIDAFAHCVGMSDRIQDCREYQLLRTVNRVLIKKSALQMDLQLEKYVKSIDNLLINDFSELQVDLSSGARRHLDQFRSFLQSHFKSIYGSWPLSKDQFHKTFYQELLVEFDCLYSYLADLQPGNSAVKLEASNDLNVQRIVDSFDEKRSLEPLPYTTPLIPDVRDGTGYRTQAHWALRMGKTGSKNKLSPIELVREANIAASNRHDNSVLESPLVQAFERFEADRSKTFDDQLSFADARKVRWILIYAMLQTLVCTTRAPPEVRDIDSASYPLCCSIAGLPTWATNEPVEPVDITTLNHKTTLQRTSTDPLPLSSMRESLQIDDEEPSNLPETPVAPLVPRKSIRRSLAVPKNLTPESADTYFSTLSSLDDSASLSAVPIIPAPKENNFTVNPLIIPTRTTSQRHRAESSTSQSSTDENPRPLSVSSDTVPSLSWSRNSPTSDTASDMLDSAGSGPGSTDETGSDSSSIYSKRSVGELAPAPPSLPKKNTARFGSDGYTTEGSFEKALWGDDGEFVCPGLAF